MARKKRNRKPPSGASIRLVPKLRTRVEVWVAEHRDDYRYYGRPIGKESLGAAVIVWFLGLPEREQRAILDASLPLVEAAEREWNREMDAKEVGEAEKGEMAKGRARVSHSKDVPTGKAAGKRRGA